MNTATYSPEDDKLRLYVGRVPRDEYEKLRAEGWTSTPKQSCDFVATWTPHRRNTALEYADLIEDEDQSPEDRAADRAERFGGYLDKRLLEATGAADRFDAGPTVHGYQSQARAERMAARHDRVASVAVDAWSKAEYWQRRTAGVIAHALYKSSPAVRMGRIKTLEAELRKVRASLAEYAETFRSVERLRTITEPELTAAALRFFGSKSIWANYNHPRASEHPSQYRRENKLSLYSLLEEAQLPITGTEALALYFSNHPEPRTETDWTQHLEFRISYENQMLEAQGGRAAFVEMIPGGWLGSRQVEKVNKSSVTGRVVSVIVRGPRMQGWAYQVESPAGKEYSLYKIETERLAAEAYRPPTEEELATFTGAEKKAQPKVETVRLINPTDADAQRLQDRWNEIARLELEERNKRNGCTLNDFTPSEIVRTTQAKYSGASKGTYASAGTRGVFASGFECENYYNAATKMRAKYGKEVCQVRRTSGGNYLASRVIVLTDKPQKPLPASVWTALEVLA